MTEDELTFDKYNRRGAGYHWEQISKSVTKMNVFVKARYELALDQIKSSAGKRIVDIGCGDGALTYLFSRQKEAHVIGVDSSIEAINFAREKTRGAKNIEFIIASAYNLPFADDSIDYIISSDVIEHLKQPEKMLLEIKRAYGGNGKVIITTPIKFTERPLDKMHVYEYFESELKTLLNKFFQANIRIIKSHPLVFTELQNRHYIIKYMFNLLNLVFRLNPFKNTRGWRCYAMQMAVLEGK
jgi:ubiquinone/menaquinone biosynthesis C-methylase UbiE